MYQVKADPQRNRLNLRVSGRLEDAELAALEADFGREIARIRPGYVGAVDVRGMHVAIANAAATLQRIQVALMRAQPSKIGTLLDSTIVEMQVGRTSKEAGLDAVARRFSDEAAWRAFLG